MSMTRKTLRNLDMNESPPLFVDRCSGCDIEVEVSGHGGAVAGLPCSSRSCAEEGFRGECAMEGSSKVVGRDDVGASSRSFSPMEDSEEDTVVTVEGVEVSEVSLGATSADGGESVGL